ncbi:28S ribosomal protein S31, mitochondrial-like [Dendronephthya gigantea]|uniref:28S ribosomal protein S31, mitochondrial-like n=1 Tax=Dendronephthya gigantea TaxID=151771 RepID=UPI001068FBA8|nr:28S ribosomal protein S31, mitochondrial-like [Dendronephthya gigantea]
MAAWKVRFSLKCTVFRGLKFLTRPTYIYNSVSPKITASQLFLNKYRYISTRLYLSKDQVDSISGNGSKEEVDKRTDIERLKELLFRDKTSPKKSNIGEEELVKQNTKTGKSIKVTQIADVLSTMRTSKDHPTEVPVHEEKVIETTEQNIDHDGNLMQSVDVNKLKDALSILEQDRSAANEVMVGQQISPESRSAIQGAYNIEQQQFRDRDKRKKIPRSSLKSGPRFHMFAKVQGNWPHEDVTLYKTIFQEMAEKEVKDLGMSVTVQSGFHDLMDNINRQWSFPIDNEVCKTEEEGISFDKHVFLEHLLRDFPKTGHIRQFMELVVTGLQQNPHLGVQEKYEHIEWFRDYFENMPDEQGQL